MCFNNAQIFITTSYGHKYVLHIKLGKMPKGGKCLPGFCESGLSMTRLGELLPSFGICGSTRRRLLKPAYLKE
jgi:hypothetical protein